MSTFFARPTNQWLRLILTMAVMVMLIAPASTPALAGQDPCPEPNQAFGQACFLGPAGPASGYLDTAEDVDTYALDLPAGAMIVATLSRLPADYSLRLFSQEGATKAEALEPGVGDKVLRADGLSAGKYFLSVLSLRGGFSAESPYIISVTYPPSTVLPTPGGATGAKPTDYVAPPAQLYTLHPADVGQGYHEVGRRELEDGRLAEAVFVADDVNFSGDPFGQARLSISPSRVTLINSLAFVAPYGDNERLAAEVNQLKHDLSSKCKVEDAQGWGSEQVWSCSNYVQPFYVRGIILKHRNALAQIVTLGLEQFTTWDHISKLMARVEQRIHNALK